jgi:hypothetical protein
MRDEKSGDPAELEHLSTAQHKWVSNIARHAREGGHPGFFPGFPLRACGNDALGLRTLYPEEAH